MFTSNTAFRTTGTRVQIDGRRDSRTERSRSASLVSSRSSLSVSSVSCTSSQESSDSTADIIKGLGPLVILIRHFEAECNLTDERGQPRHDVVDAPLTARGLLQAKKIPAVYPKLWRSVVTRRGTIWTSPMTRAIQTTLLGVPEVAARKEMVKILPALQEWHIYPCNVGSSASVLSKRFPGYNFKHCKDGWNVRTEADEVAIPQRALKVRKALLKQAAPITMLTSHGGFLMFLIEANDAVEGTNFRASKDWFGNGEARVYRFKPGSKNASLQRVPADIELGILGGRYTSSSFDGIDANDRKA